MVWIVGLDIGQARDPSALCALEADTALPIPERIYRCRALKRWPLGTSYRAVAADVARIIKTYLKDGCQLALDFTGPGRPVAEDIQPSDFVNVIAGVVEFEVGDRASRAADRLPVHPANEAEQRLRRRERSQDVVSLVVQGRAAHLDQTCVISPAV